MKTIALLAGLAALTSAAHASPVISLDFSKEMLAVSEIFTVDVVATFDSAADLGELAELSSFGFTIATDANLSFLDATLASGFDDLATLGNEVVAFAGLDGGSTAGSLTLATLRFSADAFGPASLSLTGDSLDEAGVYGLYYTLIGDPSDPLDDTFAFYDLMASGNVSVVPEPAAAGLLGGLATLALVLRRRRA